MAFNTIKQPASHVQLCSWLQSKSCSALFMVTKQVMFSFVHGYKAFVTMNKAEHDLLCNHEQS
jgi:hypothetical protein